MGVSLALIVVSLRLYTRLRVTCSAGIDDVLIVIGLIFARARAWEDRYSLGLAMSSRWLLGGVS
jgi:hypothetical protein